MNDEARIRDTIDQWLAATKRGDNDTLASILDDDVVFVASGRDPFGKREFFAGTRGAPYRFEAAVDVLEVAVHGDWALTRVALRIELTPTKDSRPMTLAGPTMSVWRKTADGRWVIWRDANMVTAAGA